MDADEHAQPPAPRPASDTVSHSSKGSKRQTKNTKNKKNMITEIV